MLRRGPGCLVGPTLAGANRNATVMRKY